MNPDKRGSDYPFTFYDFQVGGYDLPQQAG